tara:strand:- start:19 stop:180 length:162 start_codon:yes stop_codon:yes gene_type:complete
MAILADGFCKKTMTEKRGKYKQKQKNVQRLKLFLKKIENGTGDLSQKRLGLRK